MLTDEQEALLKTSLHPLRGRIACVTVQVGHDSTPVTHTAWTVSRAADGVRPLYRTPDTSEGWDAAERAILDALRATLGESGVTRRNPGVIVGHNVKGFDLQWLYVRALKHAHPLLDWLPWPLIGGKPWSGGSDDRIHDTMDWLRGPGKQGQRLRLTETLAYLGMVPADEDVGSGADVAGQWLRGEYAAIQHHCEVDVRRVMELHRRICPTRGLFIGLDIETIPNPLHPLFTADLLEQT